MGARRVASIALVLAAVYLVVSVAPVGALNVAVVSSNSTATELGNGTLSNAEVERSGEAGFVGYGLYNSSAVSRWAFDFGSGGTAYDYVGTNDGSINGATWTTGKGEGALDFEATNNDNVDIPDLPDLSTGYAVTGWIKPESATQNHHIFEGRRGDNLQEITIRVESDGSLNYNHRTSGAFSGLSEPINIGTEWVHFAAVWDGSTQYLFINGTLVDSTSAADIDTDPSKFKIGSDAHDPDSNNYDGLIADIRVYSAGLTTAQAERLADHPNAKLSDMSANWWQQNASYEASHSVENSVEGRTNLTLRNSSATVTFETGAGAVLNSTTYTTSGNRTLTWSESSATSVVLNVTFDPTDANNTARLHYESVSANNHDPIVNDSSATPDTTSSTVGSLPITLEVEINDPDFPTAQGDTDTVEFYVDGSLHDTTTITSNQTVSTTVNSVTGGTHDWHVEVADDYGGSATGSTYQFAVPSNLTIRKELAPDEVIDSAMLNATIYYGDEVETRTITDGNLSLTSFPTGEALTVRINSSGYYTRTAVIEDVFSQSDMYLLNASESAYLVRFDLQDPTGNYPREDTVLFIDRDLNQSSVTDWRIIAGDNFGVQGVPVDLDQNERYRLRIKNLETGDTNTIGGFTAIQAETVTISAGSATIEIRNSTRAYNWEARENETAQTITVEYNDTAGQTDVVKITIHERFNKSNVLVDNTTYTGVNDLVHQESLTNDQVNTTWMAELYVDRGSGFEHYRVPITGGPRNIIPADLDPVWLTAIGVFVMLISAMAFSQLNQGVGAITTSLIGGLLWYLGVLSGVAVGPAIVAALGISVVYHYQNGGA